MSCIRISSKTIWEQTRNALEWYHGSIVFLQVWSLLRSSAIVLSEIELLVVWWQTDDGLIFLSWRYISLISNFSLDSPRIKTCLLGPCRPVKYLSHVMSHLMSVSHLIYDDGIGEHLNQSRTLFSGALLW